MFIYNVDPGKVDPKRFRKYFWRYLLLMIALVVGFVFVGEMLAGCSRKVVIHGKGLHADSLYYETENVLKMREK